MRFRPARRWGARVVAVGRTEAKLQHLQAEAEAEGWDLATFRCDVGCPKSVHRLARDVVRQYGVVNVRDRECGRWSRLSMMASTPPIVEASDAEAD